MRRGDIVRTVGRSDFSNKPRPSLIVQADPFNLHHPAFTVCPITSRITGDELYRIPIFAGQLSGLAHDSEVEIDRVQAIWRDRTRGVIGRAPNEVMLAVEKALRRWLAL